MQDHLHNNLVEIEHNFLERKNLAKIIVVKIYIIGVLFFCFCNEYGEGYMEFNSRPSIQMLMEHLCSNLVRYALVCCLD